MTEFKKIISHPSSIRKDNKLLFGLWQDPRVVVPSLGNTLQSPTELLQRDAPRPVTSESLGVLSTHKDYLKLAT